MANNLLLRPANNDNPIPPNTYEFGVSATNGDTVTTWQDNNYFPNLANGGYVWAVRRKDNLTIIRSGYSFFTDIDPVAAANTGDPINLPITADGQTSFVIAAGEKRRKLFLNGVLQVLGTDYRIDPNAIVWISTSTVLKAGRNYLYLSY